MNKSIACRLLGLLLYVIPLISFAANQIAMDLTIQGVSCPFCIHVLTKNLSSLSNVESVQSISDTRLMLTMKPGTTPNFQLVNKTIKDSGYLVLKTQTTTMESKNKAHVEIKNQPCSNCHKQ